VTHPDEPFAEPQAPYEPAPEGTPMGADAVDLTSLDDMFDTTESTQSGEVDDGNYQCIIKSVKIQASKDGQYKFIKWELVVISGPNRNRHIQKSDLFEMGGQAQLERLPYIKGDFKTVGIVLGKGDGKVGLLQALQLAAGRSVEITKKSGQSAKSGKAYTNVYINKMLQLTDDQRASWDEMTAADQLPF